MNCSRPGPPCPLRQNLQSNDKLSHTHLENMGSSSSKPAPSRHQQPHPQQQQHRPQISAPRPVPRPRPTPPPKDDPRLNPIRPGGRLINDWKPWGGSSCQKGPIVFAGCNQQVLTQLALYDAMYTYSLIDFADYMRKVLGLTRSYGFMRSYFTPNAGACHARLEQGKRWVKTSIKQGFNQGVFAFYMGK